MAPANKTEIDQGAGNGGDDQNPAATDQNPDATAPGDENPEGTAPPAGGQDEQPKPDEKDQGKGKGGSKGKNKDSQAKPAAAKTRKVKVVRVTAKRDRFCRGGLRFGRTESVLHITDLKPAALKAIRAEPMLVVTDDELELPAGDE